MSTKSDTEIIEQQSSTSGSGLRASDILFILFRHRWLILGLTALGLVTAATLYLTRSPVYQSTAKLLVRYVADPKTADSAEGGVRSPDARGEAIMNAEAEIIKSSDLAIDVAKALTNSPAGAEISGTNGSGTLTARQIMQSLLVEVPRRSSTMTLVYRDENPERAKWALGVIVTNYLERHVRVHQPVNIRDRLTRLRDDFGNNLNSTQEELDKLRKNANAFMVADTKTSLAAYRQRLRESLDQAQNDLAGQEARIRELRKGYGAAEALVSNTPPSTMVATPQVDTAARDRYRLVSEQLLQWNRLRTDYLRTFTAAHPLVRKLEDDLKSGQAEKAALEQQHPSLVGTTPVAEPGQPVQRGTDLVEEIARLASFNARISMFSNQVARVEAELGAIDLVESDIRKLERKQSIYETNYFSYALQLERMPLDDVSRISNISVIQHPSPPFLDVSSRVKVAAIPLGAAVGLGLLLAFLIELVFDQRVKKPSEVETRLGLPLLLTVPRVIGLGRVNLMLPPPPSYQPNRPGESPVPILPSLIAGEIPGSAPRPAAAAQKTEAKPAASAKGEEKAAKGEDKVAKDKGAAPKSGALVAAAEAPALADIAPWQAQHVLRPYFEALRDRVLLSFQLGRMTHKPKLVAVTGCGERAGTTTLAAGLAAALSETGSGNVLLVDMNLGKGAVHPFFQGRPGANLTDLFNSGNREQVQVNDKLHVASAADPATYDPRPLPTRIHTLLPKMRASDYDFIIFDMPPMSETSATVALAASMDQVLLVVEGNKTTRSEVKRANAMLRRYGANVSGVFNKNQVTLPKWLGSEG